MRCWTLFPATEVYWTGYDMRPIPFGRKAILAGTGSMFYYGAANQYEVFLFDSTGAPTRVVRRRHEASQISPEQKEAYGIWAAELIERTQRGGTATDMVAGLLRTLHFPSTAPPYSALLVDSEGRLWVEDFRWVSELSPSPSARPTTWSVFDSQGVWQCVVSVPARFLVKAVSHGRVYGFEFDSLDVAHLRAYDLEGVR